MPAVLFAAALAERLLFWRATPDAPWAASAAYKGDALTWLDYAAALRAGKPFDLGLPLRPPGAAYWIAFLEGLGLTNAAALKFAWCLTGALTVVFLYTAVRRSFGPRVASMTGVLCVASTALLVLSTSLNNETPYLLLVAASFLFHEPLRAAPRAALLLPWGALHALACLVRVEHLLLFLLLLAWLTWGWVREHGAGYAAARAALGAVAFAILLLPWHLHAWGAIRRFNLEPPMEGPAQARAMATARESLSSVRWTPEALAEKERLPAFIRDNTALFVTATVAYRGRSEVGVEELKIVEEAFGYYPRPLAGHPFVAIYGPLNLSLANNPHSDGGFDRQPLEEPPPLAGGADRYPRAWVAGLPPAELALSYPGHLGVVNEGYGRALRWIESHRGEWISLLGKKLAIFWSGAALGWTGYGFPLGLAGLRRAVDVVAPVSRPWVVLWRLGMLGACIAGAASLRQWARLMPWLLWLLSKMFVTLAFFGYARHGAEVVPVVALLTALAFETLVGSRLRRLPLKPRAARWVFVGALLLPLAAETARFAHPPQVTLDAHRVEAQDPLPAGDARAHSLETE